MAAADAAAQVLGLRPGLPLAHAQALAPGLVVAEADPEGDGAALERLAAWCLRYTPLTAPDPPDGLWLDVTGCAHLWRGRASPRHGGEQAMLDDLVGRLGHSGIAARCAVADTPGAAWAVARHAAGQPTTVVVPGGQADALALLPVSVLRLPEDAAAGLRRLGVDRVGQLASLPRAPLARRFGPEVLLRLDQALGRVFEPISPAFPPEAIQHRLAFPEPLLTAEAFTPAIARLVLAVCAELELAGQGARQLALLFERVDDRVQAVRVGTAKPSRDARHLGRMLEERLGEVDLGLGVEAMHLVVLLAERLAWSQADAAPAPDGMTPAAADVSALVDRLANRLGTERVFRVAPVQSELPERSAKSVPPLTRPTGAGWPPSLPRPVRLLDPPQPVPVTALLPDHPPAAFTWRRVRRRVRRADGPERIHREWWTGGGEARAVRDYWAVEDEEGQRYWLFRRGDGADPATGDLGWFLHGLF